MKSKKNLRKVGFLLILEMGYFANSNSQPNGSSKPVGSMFDTSNSGDGLIATRLPRSGFATYFVNCKFSQCN